MDASIASAVVVPDELSVPASPVYSQKRRQESFSDDPAKRPRIEADDPSGDNGRHDSGSRDTKHAPVRRERGRERRLFGAVLGALSQNTATTAQKRRFEIEQRQLAQRKQEDHESEQRRAERAARRKEQRWIEQKRFERESMRIRHDNLLSMAHFLQTKTEPRLYYKPWETSPDEDDRIQDQIAEAKDIIRHEVAEYEARQHADNQRKRHAADEMNRHAADSQTGKSHDADAPHATSTANGATNDSTAPPEDMEIDRRHSGDPNTNTEAKDEHTTGDTQDVRGASRDIVPEEAAKDDEDENGEDVVEEAAEDTVIY
ncbi:pinin/SDK/memA/ protein conserved region-domain-containing protein [Bipolaris maydis]|nr:pinin/SDK/memA/ protein conserved region-domain-containing protein [Bipolaris maydis]KAJ5063646.1 pinin/SDK/memA/ protein conserved region-domain-containing protein [Bipolaris maydis]KAJ6199906.1 pinin/SDK/memA/ protein conserved region-domain-containing protein [Bipolaris maydis]